jgi:LPXTG-site transpeptidase (sortase) family protein
MKSAKTAILIKVTVFFSFSLALILGGVFCSLVYRRSVPVSLAFSQLPQTSRKDTAQATPKLIRIDAAHIFLPITPTEITSGKKWEAPTDGVAYLATSPLPGTNGNSILYGHNWPNRLGNIKKLHAGDEIDIIFTDGREKIFTVTRTDIVNPNQTHVLAATTDTRLTLYTCTGLFDSKRFVVTAVLKVYTDRL